jgi:hypothetical protein
MPENTVTHLAIAEIAWFMFGVVQKGVGYGMEMDSYKSQNLDGVLVQKRNSTSLCLKLYGPRLKCFGTKCTHSCIPGLKGEALYSELRSFFIVSANRRLPSMNLYRVRLNIHCHRS